VSQDTSIDDHEAEAARRLAGALDPSMIDALLADAKTTGTPIDGVDGLLNQMTKAVIERALQAEMTHELAYARDDPAGVRGVLHREGHKHGAARRRDRARVWGTVCSRLRQALRLR
jgi:hypothetical protein